MKGQESMIMKRDNLTSTSFERGSCIVWKEC